MTGPSRPVPASRGVAGHGASAWPVRAGCSGPLPLGGSVVTGPTLGRLVLRPVGRCCVATIFGSNPKTGKPPAGTRQPRLSPLRPPGVRRARRGDTPVQRVAYPMVATYACIDRSLPDWSSAGRARPSCTCGCTGGYGRCPAAPSAVRAGVEPAIGRVPPTGASGPLHLPSVRTCTLCPVCAPAGTTPVDGPKGDLRVHGRKLDLPRRARPMMLAAPRGSQFMAVEQSGRAYSRPGSNRGLRVAPCGVSTPPPRTIPRFAHQWGRPGIQPGGCSDRGRTEKLILYADAPGTRPVGMALRRHLGG